MANKGLESNGCKPYLTLDLDEGVAAAAKVIKASAGLLYGLYLTNRTTSPLYVKLYNGVTAVVGTDTPVNTFEIPANSSDHIAVCFGIGGKGLYFDTGICIGCTTGFANADVGAPATNAMIANAFYL